MAVKHRMTWTHSKGTIKVSCRCGWQSQRKPNDEEGNTAIRKQIKKHKEKKEEVS